MSFFDLFRRQKPPQTPFRLPDSTDDWKVGDIAICVQQQPWLTLNGLIVRGPDDGQSLPVFEVVLFGGAQFLIFEQFLPNFYHAAAFVKVRPDERKACDPAFNKLIRKRSRERIDA